MDDSYYDRSPSICPAGMPKPRNWSAAECLQEYPLQDKVDALLHGTGIFKEPTPVRPVEKLKDYRNRSDIKEVLTPAPPSTFQMLVNDLKETTYHSFWNKAVGKSRDPRPLLPPGVHNETRTFGKPPAKRESLYKVVLPEKNQHQVLRESQEGHDLYKRSHMHYNPSERVNRNYIKPFSDTLTFGCPKKFGGKGAKHCLKWIGQDYMYEYLSQEKAYQDAEDANEQCELKLRPELLDAKMRDVRRRALRIEEGLPVVCSLNVLQGRRIDRREPRLGQCLTPNYNYVRMPPCFTYGKSNRDPHTVASLFQESLNSPKTVRMHECISHINRVRRLLSRRREQLPYDDIRDQMIFIDKEKVGWLPFYVLVRMLITFHVVFDHKCVIDLLRNRGDALPLCPETVDFYANNEEARKLKKVGGEEAKYSCQNTEDFSHMMLDYMKLVDLLDWRIPLSELGEINDSECLEYKTTYSAANEDYKTDIHKDLGYAGIPTTRYDIERPSRPLEFCEADIENLAGETTAAALIYPSIMSQFGVNHRDFLLPRTADVVRGIFEGTGVEFPEDTFDVIFKEAAKADCFKNEKTCCVETFRNQLHKLAYEYYNATV